MEQWKVSDEEIWNKALEFAHKYLKIKEMPQIGFYEDPFNTNRKGNYDSKNQWININLCLPPKEWQDRDLQLIHTLFHELVHHKQVEIGWLKMQDNLYFWKKNNTKGQGYYLDSFIKYFNSPHEQQARSISNHMIKIFKNHLK